MATITETLAEIRTISKRVEKKRQTVVQYLARQDKFKDPLAAEGGSEKFIAQERQAIHDLEERVVGLRAAIAKANATTTITVNGSTRTVADWLTWRREVAPGLVGFLSHMRRTVDQARKEAQNRGVAMVSATASVAGESKPDDIVVNVSEGELVKEIEALEETLGQLDGALSLKNATTEVTL